MSAITQIFPTDDPFQYGRTRARVSAEDLTRFRLDSIEKAVAELAESSRRFAEQQALMNADIRILVKEQMRLTKTLNGIASFQSDVRSLHSTMQRWFGRVERLERDMSSLRNDFAIREAREAGQRSVIGWMADHWQIMAILAAIISYGTWIIRGSGNG